MLVKVVASVFMCFVVFFGVRNLDMLLTAPRTADVRPPVVLLT